MLANDAEFIRILGTLNLLLVEILNNGFVCSKQF